MSKDGTMYVAELRKDQWDLIVLALKHVRGMADGQESAYTVDKLGRILLRRCVNEIVTDIEAQIPEETKG